MNYRKSSGRRAFSEPRVHDVPAEGLPFGEDLEDGAEASSLDGYTKGSPVVEARLFFVLVEGEKKEVDYLRYFQGENRYRNLRIISFPMSNAKGFGGNVVDKIAEAIERIETANNVDLGGMNVNFAGIDSLYVVIDVDDLYDQIKEHRSRRDTATWVISNPCFEIWLYYSFHETPEKDFNLHAVDGSKRSQELKKQLNEVHSGGIGCRQAFENLKAACANSRKNYSENADGMPSLYSTNMHVLGEEIYNTIEYEYNERRRLRQEQILRFQKGE